MAAGRVFVVCGLLAVWGLSFVVNAATTAHSLQTELASTETEQEPNKMDYLKSAVIGGFAGEVIGYFSPPSAQSGQTPLTMGGVGLATGAIAGLAYEHRVQSKQSGEVQQPANRGEEDDLDFDDDKAADAHEAESDSLKKSTDKEDGDTTKKPSMADKFKSFFSFSSGSPKKEQGKGGFFNRGSKSQSTKGHKGHKGKGAATHSHHGIKATNQVLTPEPIEVGPEVVRRTGGEATGLVSRGDGKKPSFKRITSKIKTVGNVVMAVNYLMKTSGAASRVAPDLELVKLAVEKLNAKRCKECKKFHLIKDKAVIQSFRQDLASSSRHTFCVKLQNEHSKEKVYTATISFLESFDKSLTSFDDKFEVTPASLMTSDEHVAHSCKEVKHAKDSSSRVLEEEAVRPMASSLKIKLKDLPKDYHVATDPDLAHCHKLFRMVRDQGYCGSCYLVSPSTILQDRLCIAMLRNHEKNKKAGKPTFTPLEISAQYLGQCGTVSTKCEDDYYANGCEGGDEGVTYKLAKTKLGLASDKCGHYNSDVIDVLQSLMEDRTDGVKFTAEDETKYCSYTDESCEAPMTVSAVVEETFTKGQDVEELLMQAVYAGGSVSVAIYPTTRFSTDAYAKRVYVRRSHFHSLEEQQTIPVSQEDAEEEGDNAEIEKTPHAVALVGWGTELVDWCSAEYVGSEPVSEDIVFDCEGKPSTVVFSPGPQLRRLDMKYCTKCTTTSKSVKLERKDSVDYWVIRNTWSQRWGEEGFVRVIRGTKGMPILSYAYPVFEKEDINRLCPYDPAKNPCVSTKFDPETDKCSLVNYCAAPRQLGDITTTSHACSVSSYYLTDIGALTTTEHSTGARCCLDEDRPMADGSSTLEPGGCMIIHEVSGGKLWVSNRCDIDLESDNRRILCAKSLSYMSSHPCSNGKNCGMTRMSAEDSEKYCSSTDKVSSFVLENRGSRGFFSREVIKSGDKTLCQLTNNDNVARQFIIDASSYTVCGKSSIVVSDLQACSSDNAVMLASRTLSAPPDPKHQCQSEGEGTNTNLLTSTLYSGEASPFPSSDGKPEIVKVGACSVLNVSPIPKMYDKVLVCGYAITTLPEDKCKKLKDNKGVDANLIGHARRSEKQKCLSSTPAPLRCLKKRPNLAGMKCVIENVCPFAVKLNSKEVFCANGDMKKYQESDCSEAKKLLHVTMATEAEEKICKETVAEPGGCFTFAKSGGKCKAKLVDKAPGYCNSGKRVLRVSESGAKDNEFCKTKAAEVPDAFCESETNILYSLPCGK